eukprot:123231-Prymnesium_polylepis.1
MRQAAARRRANRLRAAPARARRAGRRRAASPARDPVEIDLGGATQRVRVALRSRMRAHVYEKHGGCASARCACVRFSLTLSRLSERCPPAFIGRCNTCWSRARVVTSAAPVATPKGGHPSRARVGAGRESAGLRKLLPGLSGRA